MTKLKKYNLDGAEIGEVEISQAFSSCEINSQIIKDYIVAIRENKRQWSASTKGRSEVRHTTKKPRPQKGSGNARQGCLVAPQFRGGGVVFGPKPKFDQHVRINKKERRAAIRFLIGEKIRAGKICVIESSELEAPRTKIVANFLKNCNFSKRVLFLGESEMEEIKSEEYVFRFEAKSHKHNNFKKSLRNLQKVEFSLAQNINGYDVMLANQIVMTEAAMHELENWLCAANQ